MHKIEIPVKHLVKEFPSEIQEMDQDQFVHFIGLILQYLGGKITIDHLKASMIIRLLDVKMDFMYAFLSREERENAYAEIFRLGDLCESFFEQVEQDGKQVKTFKLGFTRNFIPMICGNYHGPMDAVQDITFAEYRLAHSHYAAYLESQSETDLNHLIAVLYRPAKRFLWFKKLLPSFDGQVRVPLTAKSNPLFLEARVQAIAKLPMAIRYGIFLFFSGCEQFLSTGTLNVDGKTIDLSIIYQREDDSDDSPDIGLVGILYSLAETKVFGSIEETDSQNLYDIMIRLYQVVKQSQALTGKFKSNGAD
ncbi:MAG: hypothetical protein ACOYNC_18840 [Bacteroidales bacterium]